MQIQFSSLLKKDLRLVVQSKFYLIIIGSLLVYSLYINFVYVKTDIDNYPVYVYNRTEDQLGLNADNIKHVHDDEEFYQLLESDKESIGILVDSPGIKIIISESGSKKTDNLKQLYAQDIIQNDRSEISPEIIGLENFKLKKRIEMVSVIVFFEITTISFLGIAALFFQEKKLGVLKVYGVLPASKLLFIFSKVLIFFLLEIFFVTFINWINLEFFYSWQVSLNLVLQVAILSPMMVLLGFFFSLIYKNFKQFVYAYTVIIIAMTSPVFLFVNTQFEWSGIKYFPTYHLYSNLSQAYFNNLSPQISYYLFCIFSLSLLCWVDYKLFNRELVRG